VAIILFCEGIMFEIIAVHPLLALIGTLAAGGLVYECFKDYLKGEKLPLCPKCRKPMLTKVAKKGKHKGKQFWGCVDYESRGCNGLREKTIFDKKALSQAEIEYRKKINKHVNKD